MSGMGARRRRVAGLLGLIASSVLGGLASGDALAGPEDGDTVLGQRRGLAYVSDAETTVDPDATVAEAACPNVGNQWQIVGGGLESDSDEAELASSQPHDLPSGDPDLAQDDYWSAATTGSVADAELTTFAICAKSATPKYRLLDVAAGASSERSASVKCPAGTVVAGGGGLIGSDDSFINAMFPAGPRKWTFRAADAMGGAGAMEVDAVCLRSAGHTQVKGKGTLPAAGRVSVRAKCPGLRRVVGGGVRMSGPVGAARVVSSAPEGFDPNGIPDDAWRVTMVNESELDLDVTAFATCRS